MNVHKSKKDCTNGIDGRSISTDRMKVGAGKDCRVREVKHKRSIAHESSTVRFCRHIGFVIRGRERCSIRRRPGHTVLATEISNLASCGVRAVAGRLFAPLVRVQVPSSRPAICTLDATLMDMILWFVSTVSGDAFIIPRPLSLA